MKNSFFNRGGAVNAAPGYKFFKDQIGLSEHTFRQSQNALIRRHLLREHNVKERANHAYTFKGKTFTPAVIVLQGLKTVINFHTAYLVGNPVTITGTPDAVAPMNRVYRLGNYAKIDWQILSDLMTYGNAFEYVFMENGKIKSKVIRNQDAYPIYDSAMRYKYFVEFWKGRGADKDEHMVVYYPDKVETYLNGTLIETSSNLSGLPIHYTCMDKADFDQYGDAMPLDLIPIQDKVEGLLSKLDDAVTTLSLNPLGVLKGIPGSADNMIDSNVAGAVLNLGDGEFNYANAEMDEKSIKLELDQLYQQFNLIGCVPSSVLGQSNIANVSENSMSMVYQLTENKGKENMNSLIEGFRIRWEYIRKLLALDSVSITDEDFDSLNVAFNINKPIDTKQNMENMKTQYEMGALSKKTIIERSPYTTDSAQEMQRLQEEGKSVEGASN